MLETAFVPVLGFIFESLGLLALPHIAGAVWASGKAINHTEGAATPVWLAFIWLVPCIGPVLALIAIRKKPFPPAPPPV